MLYQDNSPVLQILNLWILSINRLTWCNLLVSWPLSLWGLWPNMRNSCLEQPPYYPQAPYSRRTQKYLNDWDEEKRIARIVQINCYPRWWYRRFCYFWVWSGTNKNIPFMDYKPPAHLTAIMHTFPLFWGIGINLGKIWYQKSLKIGLGNIWYRKSLKSVSNKFGNKK